MISSNNLSLKSYGNLFSGLNLHGMLILNRQLEDLSLTGKHQKPEWEGHENASSLPLPEPVLCPPGSHHSPALTCGKITAFHEKWSQTKKVGPPQRSLPQPWTCSHLCCAHCSHQPYVAKKHLKPSCQ